MFSSFVKLMRACAPSSALASSSKYYSMIHESEWMNQLSGVLQLAGAVADLMDTQGSSVLVCLEEGYDVTAQVGIVCGLVN